MVLVYIPYSLWPVWPRHCNTWRCPSFSVLLEATEELKYVSLWLSLTLTLLWLSCWVVQTKMSGRSLAGGNRRICFYLEKSIIEKDSVSAHTWRSRRPRVDEAGRHRLLLHRLHCCCWDSQNSSHVCANKPVRAIVKTVTYTRVLVKPFQDSNAADEFEHWFLLSQVIVTIWVGIFCWLGGWKVQCQTGAQTFSFVWVCCLFCSLLFLRFKFGRRVERLLIARRSCSQLILWKRGQLLRLLWKIHTNCAWKLCYCLPNMC